MQPENLEISSNDPERMFAGSEDTKSWLSKIRQSEKIIEAQEKDWNRYIAYYKNNFVSTRSNSDRITVNYIYATIKTAIPQLYFKNPYITVSPRKVRQATIEDIEKSTTVPSLEAMVNVFDKEPVPAEKKTTAAMSSQDRARVTEVLVNYEFDELKIKKEIKKCILDAKTPGIGYMKIGYTFETELVAKKDKDGRIDYDEKIKKDQIHVYRLSPKQVIVPVGFDDLERMPWIAIKYIRPLDDVKNNSNYKNAKDVTGEYINMRDFYSSTNRTGSYDEKSQELFATIYEIWDRRKQKVITISKNGVELSNKDWPYLMDGFPVERLSFIDIPDEYYPVSGVSYLEPQNLELNKYRTRQIRHNERFNRKYIYSEDQVDKAEANKLQRGDDGIIVKARGSALTAITPISDAPLSSDNRFFQEDIKQDMRIMSGFDDLQLGAGVRGAQTATEANISEQNKKLRIDEEADVVQDFVNSICRKMVQLMLQFYDMKRVVEITGEDGIKWTPIVDKELIQGEYDVRIEVGSTLPFTDDVRRQQLTNLVNLLGAPVFAKYINVPGILTQVLRAYPNIKNPEQFIKVEESNREALLHASNENELLFMGRPINASPDEAHAVHLKEHADFLKAQPVGTLDDNALNNFTRHIIEHKQFLTQGFVDEQRQGSPIGGSAPSQNQAPTGVAPNMSQEVPVPDYGTQTQGQVSEVEAGQ
jgi:hypothetical protein